MRFQEVFLSLTIKVQLLLVVTLTVTVTLIIGFLSKSSTPCLKSMSLASQHDLTNAPLGPEVIQIWTSTGFCPPAPHYNFQDFMALQGFAENVHLIGSLPYNQSFQIRVHWLLDLVSYDPLIKNFDYQKLDYLVSLLHTSGLSIGFELMGNPSSMFDDFEDPTQIQLWYRLVYEIGEPKQSAHGVILPKKNLRKESLRKAHYEYI